MKNIKFHIVVLLMLAAVLVEAAAVGKAVVSGNRKFFAPGEEIVFELSVAGSENKQMQVELYIDGNRVKCEKVSSLAPYRLTAKLDKPGWVAAFVDPLDAKGLPLVRNKKASVFPNGIGIMVAPEKLLPAVPAPADFVSFWAGCRKELAAIPLKSTRKVVKLGKNNSGFQAWDVKVDCGKTPVSGYLTMPVNASERSLPAVVSFHGAGVRSAKLIFRKGAISFDINAHGVENGRKSNFYGELYKQQLTNYWLRGKESRDKFYFKWMYLRVLRALEFVKSLPQWNGKVLVVTGSSQGGAQSLVAAALDPDVTLCVAGVPALSDHGGALAGRRPGWPRLSVMRKGQLSDPEAAETARYYDCNNFAELIRCPVWLSTGLVDFTCAPTSVYTVYNNLKVKKFLQIVPHGTHRTDPTDGFAETERAISGR